jgi:hypothetical protein
LRETGSPPGRDLAVDDDRELIPTVEWLDFMLWCMARGLAFASGAALLSVAAEGGELSDCAKATAGASSEAATNAVVRSLVFMEIS